MDAPAVQPIQPDKPRPIVRFLGYVFALAKGIIALFVVGALIQTFIATPFRISGVSMAPNFADGQFVLVDKITYLTGQPSRGDVVVLHFPANPAKLFIKRIVGLPGETVKIQEGKVSVNGAPLSEAYIPEGESSQPDQVKVLAYEQYFVMGDNRPNSNDSRYWGQLPREDIVGIVRFSLSPQLFGWISQPAF